MWIKKRERVTYPLEGVSSLSNFELIKRLTYAKEILINMLNQNKNSNENCDAFDEKSKNNEHNKQEKEIDKVKNSENDKEKEEK